MAHAATQKFIGQCEETLKSLGRELAKIRTGRANVAILDTVKVDYYGTSTPLKQMANITVPESRQLLITPWDATQIGAIEKAILSSDLGLNPTNDGKVVRINIPALTEERRKDLAKLAKKYGEQFKVSVRGHRKDANEEFKRLLKDKTMSEDEVRKHEADIQKVTDDYSKKIDAAVTAKEKEITEI